MQGNEMEQLFLRSMRRTDILRAVVAGCLAGICIIVSAYVSLSAGLWTGIAAFIALGAFWNYSHRRRQKPITDQIMLPALSAAFEQTTRPLPGKLPQAEQALLFPGDYTAKCSNMVSAVWQGMAFTFANVFMRQGRRGVFHGQWLVVRTDWAMEGRLYLREHREDDVPVQADHESKLPVADSALLRSYHVETDSPNAAAAILSSSLLHSLLTANEGTHMLVEDGVVHLAIPSDYPFFEMTGLEESVLQVNDETQRQIAAIQSWLDGILAVEFPRCPAPEIK